MNARTSSKAKRPTNKAKVAKPKTAKPKTARVRKMAVPRSLRCPGCRVELESLGEIELLEGGTATALLSGPVGEGHWLLERYVCPKCRVVTLREPAVEMLSFE